MDNIRLDTNAREVDGFRVLDVSGEIDVYTGPVFKEAINSVIASGQKDLILNMEGVTYMDSSGFGTLLSAVKRLKPEGGSINLVACSSSIERMLTITRLNTVFGLYETLEEALRQLADRRQTPT